MPRVLPKVHGNIFMAGDPNLRSQAQLATGDACSVIQNKALAPARLATVNWILARLK